MIKKLSFALLLSSAICADQHSDGETSHTFFTQRSWYGTDMPVYTSSTRYLSNLKQDGRNGLIQAIVYGGQSTNSAALGRYFCPFNMNTLTVESNPSIAGNYQVIGANLNLQTVTDTFESIVSFNPQQSIIGCAFNFKQEFGDKWWIEGTLPIERVVTNVHMKEEIINDGGGASPSTGPGFGGVNNAVGSFTQAMSDPNLQYGRVNGSQHTVGLANIEVRGGYKTVNHKNFYWSSYVGVLIPGGNVPKGVYMFEAIRGNGGHVALTTGSDFGFPWIERQHFTVSIEGGLNGGYVFQTLQTRSFDLNNKQWGRYLAVCTQGAPTVPQYGANYLTQDVNVSPRSYRSITLALLVDHICAWQAEFGYQFFGRQREHVELAQPWVEQIGLYDFLGTEFTASARTINNNANNANDTEFITIKESDIDLASATQPSTVSYVFYGALAKTFDTKYPILFGGGASYEVGSSNENMDRWTLWLKADVMF